MWAAAGALAPEAGDRVAGAPGGPAAGDAQPARTPARVRIMAAMVRLFMITSVKSGVVIDRDGGLVASSSALSAVLMVDTRPRLRQRPVRKVDRRLARPQGIGHTFALTRQNAT